MDHRDIPNLPRSRLRCGHISSWIHVKGVLACSMLLDSTEFHHKSIFLRTSGAAKRSVEPRASFVSSIGDGRLLHGTMKLAGGR
jgi:hypothetical protein